MITLIKPKFWDKKIGLISILLLPFALISILVSILRKRFYVPNKFKTPIVCIGNIYIGGTGKTPTSVFLAKEIAKLGKKTTILRKFYDSHKDEYRLIESKVKNLTLNKSRIEGLKLLDDSNYDLIILDDGFQDYKFKKDLNIVCFNQKQLIGNGLVFPSGPLRERLSSLKGAEIVLINGKKDKKFEDKILKINNQIQIFYSYYKPLNLKSFSEKNLYALAGIGNPENFFQLLEENHLNIKKKLIFPDHYKFSKSEMQDIVHKAESENCGIIMTEKDFYKVIDFNLEKIDFLKIELIIKEQDRFLNIIKKIL